MSAGDPGVLRCSPRTWKWSASRYAISCGRSALHARGGGQFSTVLLGSVLSTHVEVVRAGTGAAYPGGGPRTWRWSTRPPVGCAPTRVLSTHGGGPQLNLGGVLRPRVLSTHVEVVRHHVHPMGRGLSRTWRWSVREISEPRAGQCSTHVEVVRCHAIFAASLGVLSTHVEVVRPEVTRGACYAVLSTHVEVVVRRNAGMWASSVLSTHVEVVLTPEMTRSSCSPRTWRWSRPRLPGRGLFIPVLSAWRWSAIRFAVLLSALHAQRWSRPAPVEAFRPEGALHARGGGQKLPIHAAQLRATRGGVHQRPARPARHQKALHAREVAAGGDHPKP